MIDVRHLTEDVDGTGRHTVLGVEGHVLVANLKRQRHQDGVVRHLDVIGAHVEEKRRSLQDLGGADVLLQVFEFNGRRGKDLGRQIDAVELLALLGRGHGTVAELLDAAGGEAVLLVRLAHLLIQ